MPNNVFAAVALACSVACLLRPIYVWSKRKSKLPLPPGPRGIPLVGNALEMQKPMLWKTAQQWGEKYGPLVRVTSFGSEYIFVNSYEASIELLEKRGANYSSRPLSTMMQLEGWEWTIAVMPYGEELRRTRGMMHRFLSPAQSADFGEAQTHAVYRMLERLLDNPNNFTELLGQATGEAIIKYTYGYFPLVKHDPIIELAEKGAKYIAQAFEPFLVNAIPALQYLPAWFPGTEFKRVAAEVYELSMDLYHKPFALGKQKIADGKAEPSMLSKLLEENPPDENAAHNEELIAKATGVTYTAGADTTVSAIGSLFIAMLLHPEVQKKAQEELDRVLGKDVLPTLEDRPNLPYLEAIMKETARWQPVTPLVIIHKAEEDDEYGGYHIPAGANIFPNIWAMLRDPARYPEPDKFIPERWLPKDGSQAPLDAFKMFYGFGRRICPGRHFADTSIYLAAANVLAAFNITKALDEFGRPITPVLEYTNDSVRHPKPVKYVLTPRSDKMKNVIHQAVEAAR